MDETLRTSCEEPDHREMYSESPWVTQLPTISKHFVLQTGNLTCNHERYTRVGVHVRTLGNHHDDDDEDDDDYDDDDDDDDDHGDADDDDDDDDCVADWFH